MKKYDCSKTADFAHEVKRMCNYYIDETGWCVECPLYTTDCDIDNITNRVIDVVQKWSDKHPEKPKLTRDESIFIRMFSIDGEYQIHRLGDGTLVVAGSNVGLKLARWIFQFIQKNETWSFRELLELEVEDE